MLPCLERRSYDIELFDLFLPDYGLPQAVRCAFHLSPLLTKGRVAEADIGYLVILYGEKGNRGRHHEDDHNTENDGDGQNTAIVPTYLGMFVGP